MLEKELERITTRLAKLNQAQSGAAAGGTEAPATEEAGLPIPIIAGLGGVVVLLAIALVFAMGRKPAASEDSKRKTVAFENPMYSEPGAAGADAQAEGLYDEPGISQPANDLYDEPSFDSKADGGGDNGGGYLDVVGDDEFGDDDSDDDDGDDDDGDDDSEDE